MADWRTRLPRRLHSLSPGGRCASLAQIWLLVPVSLCVHGWCVKSQVAARAIPFQLFNRNRINSYSILRCIDYNMC